MLNKNSHGHLSTSMCQAYGIILNVMLSASSNTPSRFMVWKPELNAFDKLFGFLVVS